MRRHSLLLFASGLFGCLFSCQTSALRAEPIPAISITAATGEATWQPSGTLASFAGPDFTLEFDFGAGFPRLFKFPGTVFGGMDDTLPLHEVFGTNRVPGGTLTVGGMTNTVQYFEGIEATPLSTAIVPSGTATIVLPAALTGTGAACIVGPTFVCTGSFVNVNFDIPGTLTYDFASGAIAGGVQTESFTATFTPVPEPATAMLLLAGLAAIFSRQISGLMTREPQQPRSGL